jgi:hypothetical protein
MAILKLETIVTIGCLKVTEEDIDDDSIVA